MKFKKISLVRFLFSFSMLLLSACSLYGNSKIPYVINAEMTINKEDGNFELGGVNVYFFNKGNKAIEKFTVVFFMFDQDGEPVITGKNNVVFSVNSKIEGHSSFQDCFSLDNYLCEIPEYPYELDYVYVSHILYEDGTEWYDAFGLEAM